MTASPRFSTPRAISFLSSPIAPRVFTPTRLYEALKEGGIPIPSMLQVHRFLSNLQDLSLVKKVHHGVYLNSMARPAVLLDEAAGLIRAGSVVSMQTVLGRWGVLNNPVPYVSCVMPGNTNSGTISTRAGVIKFFSMRPDLVNRPDDQQWNELAFAPSSPTPTATREKALLDWLWLSSSVSNAKISPPPLHDIELEDLDPHALEVLAGKMSLTQRLDDFRAGKLISSTPPRKPRLR